MSGEEDDIHRGLGDSAKGGAAGSETHSGSLTPGSPSGHGTCGHDDHHRSWSRRAWKAAAVIALAIVTLLAVSMFAAAVYLGDERVRSMVVELLNDSLMGTFEIDGLSISLASRTIEATGVRVREPAGDLVLSADALRATVAFSRLLRNEVRLTNVSIDEPRLKLVPSASEMAEQSTFSLEEAFRSRSEPEATDEAGADWSVLIEPLVIRGLALSLATLDDLDIEVSSADIVLDRFGYSGFGIKASLRGALETLDVSIDDLAFHVSSLAFDGIALALGEDHGRIDLGTIRARYAGSPAGSTENLTLSGHLDNMGAADSGDIELRIHVDGAIDLAAPAILALIPEDLAAALDPSGDALVEASVQGTAGSPRVTAKLSTTNGVIVGQRMERLDFGLEWFEDVLELSDIQVSVDGGVLQGRLSLDLSEQATAWAGNAALSALPLSRLVKAWLVATGESAEEIEAIPIPERIGGSLEFGGRDLDTPRGQASFDLRAAGFSGDPLPGVPGDLRARGQVSFDEAAVRSSLVRLTGGGLDVSLGGRFPFDESGKMDLSVSASHSRPSDLFFAFDLPLLAKEMKLLASVSGTPSSPAASGTLRMAGLVLDGVPRMDLDVPFGFSRGTMNLIRARAKIASGEVLATGSIQLLSGDSSPIDDPLLDLRLIGSDLDVSVLDESLGGRASLSAEVRGSVSEPRVNAEITVEGLLAAGVEIAEASFSLETDGEWLTLTQARLAPSTGGEVSATGRLHISDMEFETRVEGRRLEASLLEQLLEDDELALRGLFDLDVTATGKVEDPSFTGSVRLEDLGLLGEALGSARVELSGTMARVDVSLALGLQAGDVDVSGWLGLSEETMGLSVTANRLSVEALPFLADVEPSIAGRALVDLTVAGTFGSPLVSGRLFARGLTLDGERLGDGRVELSVESGAHGSHSVVMEVLGASRLEATVNLEPALAIEARGRLEDLSLAWLLPSLLEHDLDAVMTGTLTARYVHEPEETELGLKLDALTLKVGEEILSSRRPIDLDWDGKRLRLGGLSMTGPNGTLEAWGEVGDSVDMVVRGSLEMELLLPFIADFALATGTLDVDLAITGETSDPVMTGQLGIARAVKLRPRRVIREIEISSGVVRLEPGKLVLERLSGGVHSGVFRASGHADLNGLELGDYRLSFSGQSIPLRTPELLLEANADLLLSGSGARSKVSGRIEVVSGRYMEKFELDRFVFRRSRRTVEEPLAQRVPILSDIDLDLRVSSLGAMEIRADAGAFALDMVLDADLKVRGNAADPILDGRVEVTRGGLKFPRARLDVARSNLEFIPRPGEAFRPRIDLRAEGEVSTASAGEAGQTTYFVTLVLDGDLEEMLLELSSDPSLDRLEILSLLITGRRPADHFGGAAGSQADAAMVFAGSQLAEPLTRFVTQQLENHLNLELELSAELSTSGLLLVAGKEVTRRLRFEWAFQRGFSGDAPASSRARARYLISDRIFLEGTTEASVGESAGPAGSRDGARSRLELKLRLYGT